MRSQVPPCAFVGIATVEIVVLIKYVTDALLTALDASREALLDRMADRELKAVLVVNESTVGVHAVLRDKGLHRVRSPPLEPRLRKLASRSTVKITTEPFVHHNE